MSVQILSDGKVVFEFRSGFEVLTHINLILHAKFSDDMRYEYTFSETAFELLVALYGCVLNSEEISQSPLGQVLRVGPPYNLDDAGSLRRRVEALLDEKPHDLDAEVREQKISMAMYPWK
jgi:hypothetical protein